MDAGMDGSRAIFICSKSWSSSGGQRLKVGLLLYHRQGFTGIYGGQGEGSITREMGRLRSRAEPTMCVDLLHVFLLSSSYLSHSENA